MTVGVHRLLRLAAIAQASSSWGYASSLTLVVWEDGCEVWTEAGDVDAGLPRIRGTDLDDVLDRGIERSLRAPGAVDPAVTGGWGDPSSLGELFERAVRTLTPSGSTLGHIPRSRVVAGESWEVVATVRGQQAVWLHDSLSGVLAAALGDV